MVRGASTYTQVRVQAEWYNGTCTCTKVQIHGTRYKQNNTTMPGARCRYMRKGTGTQYTIQTEHSNSARCRYMHKGTNTSNTVQWYGPREHYTSAHCVHKGEGTSQCKCIISQGILTYVIAKKNESMSYIHNT